MSTYAVKFRPPQEEQPAKAALVASRAIWDSFRPNENDILWGNAAQMIGPVPFKAVYCDPTLYNTAFIGASGAVSQEAYEITNWMKGITLSILRLDDPYLVESPADPFAYRSVPAKKVRRVRVTLRNRGRATPNSYADE